MGGGFSVVLSLLALTVATLSTNIAANVVSPANAMINVNPRKISFRLGGFVTAGLGIAIFPWKLLESTGSYIFTWLVGYSALLGPIGGILIIDYFVLRRTKLDLQGLYQRNGPYTYHDGFNRAALIAFGLAVIPNVPGFAHAAGILWWVPPIWDQIYAYAWFVGFLLGGGLYWALMHFMGQTPPRDSTKGRTS
jgi:NCS1 family nucleobase:cation symporter-1